MDVMLQCLSIADDMHEYTMQAMPCNISILNHARAMGGHPGESKTDLSQPPPQWGSYLFTAPLANWHFRLLSLASSRPAAPSFLLS